MTKTAKAYIATVIVTGAMATAFALAHWRSDDPARFAMFLVLFLAAATLKCCVPGVAGTYSPIFFFALLGSTTLSLPEVWIAGGLSPNRWVDVTDTFPRKIAALKAHTSQTAHFENMADFIRGWLTRSAQQGGLAEGRLAEAYQVLNTG